MRLVNVHTLKLHEFIEGSIPPYAILSHRWTGQELTFKDVAKNRANPASKGFKKLLGACHIAARYTVDYLWIDTCCIDKRSSAELSESINSMFAWYKKARVCLVYLEDVYEGPDLDESFEKSVWFTRVWTLQELLAPSFVEFFDCDWTFLGNRNSNSGRLLDIISGATGIQKDVLAGQVSIFRYSVAERMSWASHRHATRSEDTAYSLMGIFDVNMPLLYGEGTKAFQRLQQEIIRNSSDTTILCWGIRDEENSDRRLLASSPAAFREPFGFNKESSGVIEQFDAAAICHLRTTNVGLEIQAPTVRLALNTWGIGVGARTSTYRYILLIRRYPGNDMLYKIGILSHHLEGFWIEKPILHVHWGGENFGFPEGITANGFYIPTSQDIALIPGTYRESGELSIVAHRDDIFDHESGFYWNLGDGSLSGSLTCAAMICRVSNGRQFSIGLTFDFDGRPCCLIHAHNRPSQSTIEFAAQGSVMREGMSGDYSMASIQDFNGKYWFLRGRSNHEDAYAIIPTELTQSDKQTWVVFFPPGRVSDDDHEEWWSFAIGHDRDELRSASRKLKMSLGRGT